MKVLLTGATGFTGSHVLTQLQRGGFRARCYVRSPEKALALENAGVEVARGDLADEAALSKAFAGCDALINVASIGFGHGPGIVRALDQAGVRRAVFVSTTAIFTQLNAPSKSVRVAAESAIRASTLDWTILRPTMIYGTVQDRNICRLIRFVRRSPVLPVFGSGHFLMQPIYVEDLAAGIVAAAQSSRTIGNDYNLSGAKPLTYNELAQTVAKSVGRRLRLLHIPARPAVKILKVIEKMGVRIPIKAEQVLRLNEDKAFSWDKAAEAFGFAPRTFAEGVEAEVRSMGFAARMDPVS
jgi:uncharacterized protein YbjT (DUF2867 family)